MDWYYVKDGKSAGPLTDAEFRRLVDAGGINGQTFVWTDGMKEWVPYGQVARAEPQGEGKGLCEQCGREFPVSELIQYQGVNICAECKPAFFQRVKEGAELPGVMDYAGFWTRFGAKFIDGLIMWVVNMVIAVLGGIAMAGIAVGNRSGAGPSGLGLLVGVQVVMTLIQMSVQVAYYVFFHGRFGQTPGKMALKIKVVRADGTAITYGRALGRCFAEWLSAMIMGIGYIMAAFDEEKRALHDRICDTRVIRKG